MNLIKTSFLSFLVSASKVIAGFISSKILAIYVGPAGVALLGNYNNILGILSTIASGATASGVTKYISEFDVEIEKIKVVRHSFVLVFIFSLVTGILTCIFSDYLADSILHGIKYSYIFKILGVSIFFFGVNTTTLAIINGYRNIRRLSFLSILSSLVSITLAFFTTIKFGIHGALLNTSISQVVLCVVIVIVFRRVIFVSSNWIQNTIEKKIIIMLLKFSMMALVSIALVPTTAILIRKYIITHFSLQEAGYVQGLWDISAAYLMVITMTLSVYYLPTLSGIKDKFQLRKEILRGYRYLVPIVIILGFLIYFNRELIIQLLYTPEFLPMKNLFLVQLIGDALKISSWLLGYLMIAKAMTRLFVYTELIFSGSYLILSVLFINKFGLVGVTYAYAINNLLLISYLLILFRGLIFYKHERW